MAYLSLTTMATLLLAMTLIWASDQRDASYDPCDVIKDCGVCVKSTVRGDSLKGSIPSHFNPIQAPLWSNKSTMCMVYRYLSLPS